MKKKLFCVVFLFCFTILAFGQNSEKVGVENKFNLAYSRWQDFMKETKHLLSAPSGRQTQQFKEIISLGTPALPYIFIKLKEEPVLWYSVRVITKKWFDNAFDQQPSDKKIAEKYLSWWTKGNKNDLIKLSNLYLELKSSNTNDFRNKKSSEIKNLGILAIPFLINQVRSNDQEAVKLISELTNQELEENKSPHETLKWWELNKEKWLISFPNQ